MASTSSVPNLSPGIMIEASPGSYPYPPALAKYEDVVSNPKLFISTLEKLHSAMGTKFMIPVIGGKELDLHRLFVEVTSRGGIEKLVREKKWKEVTAVFNFPSSATNASFVLRKYYISLLHHYEQIYYFKAKNWVPSSDFVNTPHKTPMSARGGYAVSALPVTPGSGVPQQNINSGMPGSQGNHPAPLTGTSVTGIIDGKFDSGYLVTITIGSQKLKGVLYQAAECTAQPVPQYQPVMVPYAADAIVAGVTASGSQRRKRRKKSEIKRRDPAHPKPNRSGYNFFFAEQHARLKTLHPGKDREISKMIGELWTNLNETERSVSLNVIITLDMNTKVNLLRTYFVMQVYQETAMKDKERYKTEMEGYREKIRTGQITPNMANPSVQQKLAGPDVTMVDVKVGESDGAFSSLQGQENVSSGKSQSGGLDDEDMNMENDLAIEASQGMEGAGGNDETGALDAGKRVDKEVKTGKTA
ncbi:hypothetical protein QQ045_030960 [Rhodiola kirilowii]